MSRSTIEASLRAVYTARKQNNAAECMRIFAPGATFRDAGHPAFCSAVAMHSGPALQPALEKLCEVFRASAFDVDTIIIDGDRAAVTCHATFLYTPTGQTASLELVHLWTFKDGKATELVEYFDTAYVSHIMAQPPAHP